MHLTFSPEAGDEFGNRLRVIAPLFGFPACRRGLPPPFLTLAPGAGPRIRGRLGPGRPLARSEMGLGARSGLHQSLGNERFGLSVLRTSPALHPQGRRALVDRVPTSGEGG